MPENITPLAPAAPELPDPMTRGEMEDSIKPLPPGPEQAIGVTKMEVADALANMEVERLKQQIELREEYARKSFWLVVSWILGIFILLVMNGSDSTIPIVIGNSTYLFRVKISEPLMLALVGTTTLNIVGLFYFVMNNLFPKDGSIKK
jgi:hypothetical protein